jgi:hypothetical protein
MNNPLQGETIFFSGFLKDDEGNIITEFAPLYTFRAFIKSKMLPNTFLFSTASSGDTQISVSTAGLVTWKILPTQSKLLQGETILEIDCTETSTGTKRLGKTIVFYVEETGISKHINF